MYDTYFSIQQWQLSSQASTCNSNNSKNQCPEILELHYTGNEYTASIRKSTPCPSWNTGNSDTIYSLYSKNDLYTLFAIPTFSVCVCMWGILQQPTPFAELPCTVMPFSGQKCCIMEAWKPMEG